MNDHKSTVSLWCNPKVLWWYPTTVVAYIDTQWRMILPRKASTRQLTPLIALKKIWGSCLRQGCCMTSCGTLLTPSSCSWNLGVELTMTGLLRSTGLLMGERNLQVMSYASMCRTVKQGHFSSQRMSVKLQTWACAESDTTSETHSHCPSQQGWD